MHPIFFPFYIHFKNARFHVVSRILQSMHLSRYEVVENGKMGNCREAGVGMTQGRYVGT